MPPTDRQPMLRVTLVAVALVCLGLYPLMVLWPSGFAWHTTPSHYQMMIVGVYATLGVFLLLAARNPHAYRSIIWFTIWSSVAHAAVMTVEALTDTAQRSHLWGDIPALFIAALALAVLAPRGADGVSPARPLT